MHALVYTYVCVSIILTYKVKWIYFYIYTYAHDKVMGGPLSLRALFLVSGKLESRDDRGKGGRAEPHKERDTATTKK